jgi:hypothetical protein
MGDEKCSVKTFETLKSTTKVLASLEISVICNGLRGVDKQAEFAALFKRMEDSNDQAERLRIIDGLTCSSDPKLIMELLQTTVVSSFETNYRMHERTRILSNVITKSSVGLVVMVDFLTQHFDDFASM